ncbi:MAG: hypothetical protein COA32_10185 [Fluviicola sp.]|nr:MAG: hypothetical protein COA32_10185 [Fluviicola sp.]
MNTVDETGGARIGRANATWPFASLNVTQSKLTLNVIIIGKFIFQPSDIKSIEVYKSLPVIGQGIKINHKVDSYKEHVVFWTFRNPIDLIEEIKQTGFLNINPNAESLNSQEIEATQKKGGFPLKTPFVIAIILLWNILFIIDIKELLQSGQLIFGFGKGVLLSTGTILLASILMLVSSSFQELVLKEGMEMKDISKFLYFVLAVVGIIFLSRLFFFI